MTLFYRPLGPWPIAQELWGRCDNCFLSGPWAQFDSLEHEDGTSIELCQLCTSSTDLDLGAVYRKEWRRAS